MLVSTKVCLVSAKVAGFIGNQTYVDCTEVSLLLQVLGKSGHQCSCDIWSAGVIMYILLVGYPPFGGATEHAILRQVRKGQYTFTGPNWDAISDDAKHCIKQMLVMKPSRRATAAELLDEKWFKHASAVSDKVMVYTLHNKAIRCTIQHRQWLRQ